MSASILYVEDDPFLRELVAPMRFPRMAIGSKRSKTARAVWLRLPGPANST
jgi:hypothetical protein